MKHELAELFAQALSALCDQGVIPSADAEIRFQQTRQQSHGDLATNLALTLAKAARRKPRDLAQLVVEALPESELIDKVEIAGPGFINVFVSIRAHFDVIDKARAGGADYGRSDAGGGAPVLIEFVSANPTGPLHVGHGRGAAYGDTLARLLRAAGCVVQTEYYVNDAGRQMNILALSVWLRYLEVCGESFAFPDNCYQGAYVKDIAAELRAEAGECYRHDGAAVLAAAAGREPEAALDALIEKAKALLGEAGYRRFFEAALTDILSDIRVDLGQFRVSYQNWFSEASLHDRGAIVSAVERLRERGHLYQKEGAWWFRSTDFGDEKDRVVLRENGAPTYFAGDIAYHIDKYERGFDRLINIWGADHHGYIARVKGAMQALGYNQRILDVALVQFAILYRGGEKVSMSTRGGEFVTLRELREEVGTDAARFFYVQRKPEQHMDFDLDLAKSQSNDNPVYYVQYAHARVCSVFKQARERGIDTASVATADLNQLGEAHEVALARQLTEFPDLVAAAARSLEPHLMVYYLRDVANALHTYYNAHSFLGTEPAIRDARLALIDAARQVIANGLELLGVDAPGSM